MEIPTTRDSELNLIKHFILMAMKKYCCVLNFGRPGQSQGQKGDSTFHDQFRCFRVSFESDSQF